MFILDQIEEIAYLRILQSIRRIGALHEIMVPCPFHHGGLDVGWDFTPILKYSLDSYEALHFLIYMRYGY